jgi:hypothetical protein
LMKYENQRISQWGAVSLTSPKYSRLEAIPKANVSRGVERE